MLSKFRSLSISDETSRARAEQLEQEIKSLQLENSSLRSQIQPQLSLSGRDTVSLRSTQSSLKKFMSVTGVIDEQTLIRFQTDVDEVLRLAPLVATTDENGTEIPTRFFESVRSLISAARNILADADAYEPPLRAVISNASAPIHIPATATKLKARVSSACNNVTVAAKTQFVSGGLAPVSLMDAAVAGLVGSVVELVKVARLRA